MATLLYIEASPRKARSHGIAVAREFLRVHAEAHPGDSVDVLDLWAEELPAFDDATLDAKYAVLHGARQTAGEAAAWARLGEIAGRFRAAEKRLFSLPMWNFAIPYRLKHYIDLITQPGLTFSYSPEAGYRGLCAGPAVAIYASGGAYGAGSGAEAMDFQKPYLTFWLGFVGITQVHDIHVAPTLAAPEATAAAERAALERARELAASF